MYIQTALNRLVFEFAAVKRVPSGSGSIDAIDNSLFVDARSSILQRTEGEIGRLVILGR